MACAPTLDAGPGSQPETSFQLHDDDTVLFHDLGWIREESQDSLRQPIEAPGKLAGDESDMAAATRKFEGHCTGNLIRRR